MHTPATQDAGWLLRPVDSLFYIIEMVYSQGPPKMTTWIKCDATINDVTYTWSNGSYFINTATPTSGLAAGAIFGSARGILPWAAFGGQVDIITENSATMSDYNAAFSNMMASGIIARAAGLLVPVNTTSAVSFSSILVTQYPIIPLLILLLLLYTYTLLAIGIMVAAMFTRTSSILLHQESGGSKRISVLALAQRSIVSPLGIIAAMLTRDTSTSEKGVLQEIMASHARASVALDDANLFEPTEKSSMEPRRVIVGLGGGNYKQPMFGVWLAQEKEKSGIISSRYSVETLRDSDHDASGP